MSPPSVAGETTTSLTQFTTTAQMVASQVIAVYSTSFGMATRLLGQRHRGHVRNIYAMVRIADEIVDGVASQAGLTQGEQRETLARYAEETHRAMRTGYSSDLIIHAFAQTARHCSIDQSLTQPFFDSMHADLTAHAQQLVVFDSQAHATYVYGSAQVVGLMCLRVFLRHSTLSQAQHTRLEHGATQLGAAFQNINFLRDLQQDTTTLGRSYLGVPGTLTDTDRDRWVCHIRTQLADAHDVMPLLPADARAAVRCAWALFAELTHRVARTPAAQLYHKRIRVPTRVKVRLALGALLATTKERG